MPPKALAGGGSRGWCFTLHATDEAVGRDQYQPPQEHKDIVYMVWQEEQAPETKIVHLQGYINFGDKKPRMAWVKQHIFPDSPHVHLEKAKGTAQQNRTYCTKEGRLDGPWEYGKLPSQGKRSDLDRLAAAIREAKGDLRLVPDEFDGKLIQYGRGARALAELQHARAELKGEVDTRKDLQVKIFWGAAGTGKTTAARTEHKDTYILAEYGKDKVWFDGYMGQATLIMDEFDPDLMSIQTFNRICDIHPYNAPVKGGFVRARWTTVVICSNIDPARWYSNHDDRLRNAFRRRITKVVKFLPRPNRFRGVDEDNEDSLIALPVEEEREYIVVE